MVYYLKVSQKEVFSKNSSSFDIYLVRAGLEMKERDGGIKSNFCF